MTGTNEPSVDQGGVTTDPTTKSRTGTIVGAAPEAAGVGLSPESVSLTDATGARVLPSATLAVTTIAQVFRADRKYRRGRAGQSVVWHGRDRWRTDVVRRAGGCCRKRFSSREDSGSHEAAVRLAARKQGRDGK